MASEREVGVHRLDTTTGDRPTLALMHGMADSWSSWVPLSEHAEGKWRVFAFDLPWRSVKDVEWCHSSPAAWVARAIDRLGVEPDVLIAHSFAANAVLQLLATSPFPPARAVILLAPALLPPSMASAVDRAAGCRGIAEAVLRRLIDDNAESAAAGAHAGVDELAGIIFDQVWKRCSQQLVDLIGGVLSLPLGSSHIPALVIGDPDDPALAAGGADMLAQRMPGAHLVLREGFGHFFHRTRPAQILHDITAFDARTRNGSEQMRERKNDIVVAGDTGDQTLEFNLRPTSAGTYFDAFTDVTGYAGLGEEVVAGWRRAQGMTATRLREEGVVLRLVGSSVQIKHPVRVDDQLVAEVRAETADTLRARMKLAGPVTALQATYKVELTRVHPSETRTAFADAVIHGPPSMASVVTGTQRVRMEAGEKPEETLTRTASRAFVWTLRLPYYYCTATQWLAHTGCVSIFQEVDDRFRFDREIPFARDVNAGRLYPITSFRFVVEAPAWVDETLYVRYFVKNIFRTRAYDARLECFVQRNEMLVRAASGLITHACAEIHDGEMRFTNLDEVVLRALGHG